MGEQIKYLWQQAVVDAFLSPSRDLPGKINIAERAISARLAESRDLDVAERTAINDALRALKVLITEARSRGTDPRKMEETREKPEEKKDTA